MESTIHKRPKLTLPHKSPATEPPPADPPPKVKMLDARFLGKRVILQTRGPSQFCGIVDNLTGQGIMLRDAEERRWLGNDLSLVLIRGTFSIERGAILYTAVAEVEEGVAP